MPRSVAPPGFVNGASSTSRFSQPAGVAADNAGRVYIADSSNNAVRMLAPNGTVSVLAGGGDRSLGTTSGYTDGAATTALFQSPAGVAPDASGAAYVCDGGNNVIRRVDLTTGATTTFAGSGVAGYQNGVGSQAQFSGGGVKLSGLVFDVVRNFLYVADTGANLLRAVDITTANVSLFAGGGNSLSSGSTDGIAGVAAFSTPTGLALNANSGQLYVADTSNQWVRVVNVTTGNTTTLTGNAGRQVCSGTAAAIAASTGTAAPSCHTSPTGLAFDGAQFLYVTNRGSGVTIMPFIQRIDVTTASTTFFAGLSFWQSLEGGTSAGFSFASFGAVAWAWGSLALSTSSCILVLNVTAGAASFSAFAGAAVAPGSYNCTSGNTNGAGSSARFGASLPWLVYSAFTDSLLVTDASASALRTVSAKPTTAVSTVVGGSLVGASGMSDGCGTSALFNSPNALAVASSALGAVSVYVSDTGNSAIRVIDVATGAVSTVAGGDGGALPGTAAGWADGAGSLAGFALPGGIAWSEASGVLYVTDVLSNRVRTVRLASGDVATVAGGAGAGAGGRVDGLGTAALLYGPSSLALDETRGRLYIGDNINSVVRAVSVDPTTIGAVVTVAGGGASGRESTGVVSITVGVGTAAIFNGIAGIAVDSQSNVVYIASGGAQVAKLNGGSGSVARFIGGSTNGLIKGANDGTGTNALFRIPAALVFHAGSSKLFIADTYNYKIRLCTTPGGVVTSLVGSGTKNSVDGVGSSASFSFIGGLALSPDGEKLYVGETAGTIRMVAVTAKQVTTLLGVYNAMSFANGPMSVARLGSASGLAVTANGTLLFTDAIYNNVRALGLTPGAVSTVAGGGLANGAAGFADGGAALFNAPLGVAASSDGATLWIADTSNGAIRRISLLNTSAVVSTLAGAASSTLLADNTSSVAGFADGASGSAARFSSPGGLADASRCGGASPFLVVSDTGNNALRAVDVATGATRTLAAGGWRPPTSSTTGYIDGAATASRFSAPMSSVFIDSQTLLVTDSANSALRLVSAANGSCSTLSAGGLIARPAGAVFVAVSATVYFSDIGANSATPYIRAVNVLSGSTAAVAGSGGSGTANGASSSASFRSPSALAANAAGTMLYVCDAGNNAIRFINRTLPSSVTVGIFCGGGGNGATAGLADGTGTSARFSGPRGIALLSAGAAGSGSLIVADATNNLLRLVDIDSAVVTQLAGGGSAGGTAAGWVDGVGSAALLSNPRGLALSAAETTLYVADLNSGHIRVVDIATATVTTLAGGGASGTVYALS